MALINPAIIADTAGYGLEGWTFSILGAYNSTTQAYARRGQGNDPKFTKDQTGADFIAGQEYLVTMQHPEYCVNEVVTPVTFATDGKLVPPELGNTPTAPLFPGGDLASELISMLPYLAYIPGMAVTIETVSTFDDEFYDKDFFDTGNQ